VSQTQADPADLAYADLLDAFMAFPAPLALLDANGSSKRVNTRFLQRFGKDGVNAAQLRTLLHDSQGGWQRLVLSLRGGGNDEVRARAARTASHVFLIVDEATGVERDVEALHQRIGELEHLAATDSLTGAWNRAHFDLVIESVRMHSVANRQPLSLLLVDIDHFKNINNAFGRTVGDTVLRELVQLLRSRMRASDLLFRWGRDEFAVLVSSAGYRGAQRVAENLREAVAGHAFVGAGNLTVSLGVAEHDGDEEAPTWLRRLSEALAEAKRAGHNRVVVSRRGNSDVWANESRGPVPRLIWEDSYACGHPTIDGQHRELFQLINILIDATLPEQEDLDAVRTALEDLLGHVVRHFADEETLLDRLNYAQLPEHRETHAGLLGRARMVAKLLNEGKSSPHAIVEFFAEHVVTRHLMVVDRAFFPMLRKGAPAFAAQQA
jgi:diguanylate cyclase (GGDEF)-like protein/hemerythrin-like metal-binding protein